MRQSPCLPPFLRCLAVVAFFCSSQTCFSEGAVNDARAEAFEIYGPGYIPGTNVEATAEPGEAIYGDIGVRGDGHSLWWRLEGFNGSHQVTLRPYRPDLSFILVVYQDTGEERLITRAVVEAEDMTPQSVRFEVEPGADYLIAVDSTSEATGWFYFAIDQGPEIHAPLSMTYQPGAAISIPIHIAGFPDVGGVEILEGGQYFSYDPSGKRISGVLPPSLQSQVVRIRARNTFGEHEATISLYPEEPNFALTSPATALGFVGVPFEYVLEFDGAYWQEFETHGVYDLPPGLSYIYDRGQWKIKGVPQRAEEVTVSMIYWANGENAWVPVTLRFIEPYEVRQIPEITSPLMSYARVGQPFNYQLETSLPVDDFDVQDLPLGLSLNRKTGHISGVPSEDFPQQVTVRANSPYGPVEGTLKLVFADQPIVQFEVPPIIYAYEGVPFEYYVQASSPLEDFWADLPPGLDINNQTGRIYGTLEEIGIYDFSLSARSLSSGEDPQMQLTIHVLDPVPFLRVTSPAQAKGVVGDFFEYQLETAPLSADNLIGGLEPSFSGLPDGLHYDAETGRILGVPQYPGFDEIQFSLGLYEFGIKFQILEPFMPPKFLSPASAIAKTNDFFFFTFSSPGADSFRMLSQLPDGLNFDTRSGVLWGQPPVEGDFVLAVRAFKNGIYSDTSLILSVMDEPVTSEPLILSPGQMVGEIGEMMVYSISSNATLSGFYNVIGLPPGFQFDEQSGVIYGSTSTPQGRSITVQHGSASARVLLQVHQSEPWTAPLLVLSPPSALFEPGQWFEFQIETNAAEIGEEIFEFQANGPWPEGLTLDPATGRVSGYLGEDWPPQLDFEIYSSEGAVDSSFVLVDGSEGRPPVIDSAGHVMSFLGDYLEYFFDFPDPATEVQILSNNTGLSYDSVQRRFSGYLSSSGIGEVEFELSDPNNGGLWTTGRLVFQELHYTVEPPAPIVTSKLAPVAHVGEVFRYQFEFGQLDGFVNWINTSADWLEQTGPLEVSGVVPEYAANDRIALDFEYRSSFGANATGEIWIHVLEPATPPVLTSPASACAYDGIPFSYQFSVSPVDPDTTIEVHNDNLPYWLSYDPEQRLLHGTPFGLFLDLVIDVTIDSPRGGQTNAQITLFGNYWLPRPTIVANTPPPAFLNVPFFMPFAVENGLYSSPFSYQTSSPFERNTHWSRALSGVPVRSQGDDWGRFSIGHMYIDTDVEFQFRYVESAPVILEQPSSMVTFPGGKAYFHTQFGGEAFLKDWFKDGDFYALAEDYLELEGVGLEDQGEYRLHLSNDIGEALSQPARLSVGTPSTLRDWTIAHVGGLIDQQLGGDPDESWTNDGVSNLMKWAMGLPLLDRASEPLVGGYHSEGALHIEFIRNVDAADVTLVVERSETVILGSWQPVARLLAGGSWQTLQPSTSIAESGSTNLRNVTVSDSRISDSGFLRVRVILETE